MMKRRRKWMEWIRWFDVEYGEEKVIREEEIKLMSKRQKKCLLLWWVKTFDWNADIYKKISYN